MFQTTINQKVDLSTPDHLVEKIPDFILLKESRKEVGKLEAEIDYLNAENDKLKEKIRMLEGNQKLTNEDIEAVKKEEMYSKLKKQFSATQMRIHELRKTNTELICQIIKLKQTT
jgi:cell division protein FtsB